MPVFNERATISEIVKRVMELPIDKELVIVDDGSTDGTLNVLKELSQPGIRILYHGKNRGKGAAIKTGLGEVSGELTIIQDADLEYDPRDYLLLLEPILSGETEVVYGSRFRGHHRNFSFLHWLGNKFLTLTTNILYRSKLSDMETCYKLFKTSVLKGIGLHADRFDCEPEITAKLLRKGIRIVEVPISYSGRKFAGGKKITWKDGFSALRVLIKYRFLRDRPVSRGCNL